MTLKIAALPPMPNARVSTATAVKPGVFSSWRKANLRSFIAQRLHRIDPGRATGRLQTGKDGDCSQNHHYAREGDTGEAACWGGPKTKTVRPASTRRNAGGTCSRTLCGPSWPAKLHRCWIALATLQPTCHRIEQSKLR